MYENHILKINIKFNLLYTTYDIDFPSQCCRCMMMHITMHHSQQWPIVEVFMILIHAPSRVVVIGTHDVHTSHTYHHLMGVLVVVHYFSIVSIHWFHGGAWWNHSHLWCWSWIWFCLVWCSILKCWCWSRIWFRLIWCFILKMK